MKTWIWILFFWLPACADLPTPPADAEPMADCAQGSCPVDDCKHQCDQGALCPGGDGTRCIDECLADDPMGDYCP